MIPSPEEAAEIAKTLAEGVSGEKLKPADTVHQETDAVHDAVQGTLEHADEEKVTPKTLLEKAQEVQKHMEEVQHMPSMEFKTAGGELTTMRKYLRAHGKEEDLKNFEETESFINEHTDEVQRTVATAKVLHEWHEGEIHPSNFPDYVKELHEAAGSPSQEVVRQLKTYLSDHALEIAAWETGPETREKIIRDMGDIASLNFMMKNMNEELEKWKAGLDEYKKGVNGMVMTWMGGRPGDSKVDTHPAAGHGSHSGFLSGIGITLYSPIEVWESFKQVGAAYKHAWDERKHLRSTILAKTIGKSIPAWTPFGGEVSLNLDKAAEAANKKETNEFKEYLEDRNFTFRDLFIGDGNMSMGHNHHEPNKARAILEYAAGRGWLYDLAEQKGNGNKKILGYAFDDLLNDWTPDQRSNYFIKLIGQNTGGEEKEIKDGKAREQTTDRANLFVRAIDKELGDLNFWGAIGVVERAIERGLVGEIGPWIATRFLRVFRDDPSARRYVNRQVLDQLGIRGFNRAGGFTLALYKWERNTHVEKWVKGEPQPPLHDAGTLGKIVGMLEGDIQHRSGRTFSTEAEKAELDHIVAKVLSAQTVEFENGKSVSIWENKYKPYFKNVAKDQKDANPGKEEPDYYFELSDVLLSNGATIESILDVTGSGQFKEYDRADPFIITVLELHKNLLAKAHDKKDIAEKNRLEEAAENFREDMREKMDTWFTTWSQETRAGPIATKTLSDGRHAILSLVQKGFINFDLLVARAKTASATNLLAVQVLIQMADERANTERPDLRKRAWDALPDKIKQNFNEYRVIEKKEGANSPGASQGDHGHD